MEGQKEIEFELEGICPLKMDRYVDGVKAKTEEEYKKEAVNKVYNDEKGNISMPTTAIKASIRIASSELGKRIEAKKNRQFIRAGVFFEKDYLPLLDKKDKSRKKYDCIVKDIVTRGKGEKVTRVSTFRPLIEEWKVKGKVTLLGVTPNFFREAMELAGIKYGLLSHRPEFGRFIVNKFKEV